MGPRISEPQHSVDQVQAQRGRRRTSHNSILPKECCRINDDETDSRNRERTGHFINATLDDNSRPLTEATLMFPVAGIIQTTTGRQGRRLIPRTTIVFDARYKPGGKMGTTQHVPACHGMQEGQNKGQVNSATIHGTNGDKTKRPVFYTVENVLSRRIYSVCFPRGYQNVIGTRGRDLVS